MNRNELVSAVFENVVDDGDIPVTGSKQAINASNWWGLRLHEFCNEHVADSSANINLGIIMSCVLADVVSCFSEAGGEAKLSQEEVDALNNKRRDVIRALITVINQPI
jgi:hypothetical protein